MTGRLAGQRVVVTDCREFMGPDIVDLFREEGARVTADARDLTRPQAAHDLIDEAGEVDVLVANLAYAFTPRPAVERGDDEMAAAFERLVYPLHRLARAVLPRMMRRRGGKIVVVGSAAALRGRQGLAVYSAARAAQHGYVRSLALEAAPYVNVNATAQTFVDNPTYFPKAYQETEEFRKRLRDVPAGRLATGREAAELVLFLASPQSSFFHGQVVPFAGGWV
ncbi:MAG TPA: SDR family oxidoreductase [Ramlibacter sp.]|nr:SDR family oxidoreductase [Ramlibacter sp.]